MLKPKSDMKVPLTLTQSFALRASCEVFKGPMLMYKVCLGPPLLMTLIHS